MNRDPLQMIVGRAVIDTAFCQSLLLDPRSAIAEYPLDREQARALTAIRARSLDEFAAGVEQLRQRGQATRTQLRPGPSLGWLQGSLRAAV